MTDGLAAAFTSAVKKYRRILIYIQGSPDPDAIASSHAIKIMLSRMNIESEIISGKKISLSQNKAFVRSLNIPLKTGIKPDPEKFDSYIVADFQSNIVQGISGRIPCAAHIDHHDPDSAVASADFSLVRPESGSTSSLVAIILRQSDPVFSESEMRSMATALMFGIQTDTDDFQHTSQIDMDALHYLSEYADMEIIRKIEGIPLSPQTIKLYRKALEHAAVYKDWGIFGTGYIDIEHRDSIAITADLLLKNTGYKTVAVYALVEDKRKDDLFMDVSFRTVVETLDLNSLIKRITPTGGGRKFKGAYQVKLGYLNSCREREMLWQVTESATLKRIRDARDGLHLYKIKKLPARAFEKIASFLKNKGNITR
ncbi:MAG TPA: DHH family phosphoesterase [Spirochaetota bacterium]|nr:DHH family phosphoesterase [Spirochaetota bacterium]